MGIRIYKPTSAGRRGGSVSDFAECTTPRKNKPEKSLLVPNKKQGGRNNQGVITVRFRGGGHKQMYRLIDFKRNKKDGVAAAVTRSYSMASTMRTPSTLQFIIRKYPDGAFSSLVDTSLTPGTALQIKGPFGSCFRRDDRAGPMVLVGGGSGMSPLWAILQDHIESGEQRPIRFFYGARTRKDLFFLDEFAAVAARLTDFEFIPVLSQATPEDEWHGETGFVHEAVERILRTQGLPGEIDAYTCGPPPMIDAVLPVLQRLGVALDCTHVDKFTPASASTPNLVH